MTSSTKRLGDRADVGDTDADPGDRVLFARVRSGRARRVQRLIEPLVAGRSRALVVSGDVAQVGRRAAPVGTAVLAVPCRHAARSDEPPSAGDRVSVLGAAALPTGLAVRRLAALEDGERRVSGHAVRGADTGMAAVPAAALAHGAALSPRAHDAGTDVNVGGAVGRYSSVEGRPLAFPGGVPRRSRVVRFGERCAAKHSER